MNQLRPFAVHKLWLRSIQPDPRCPRARDWCLIFMLEFIMSLTLKSVLLGMMVLFMAGCNTMEGAGRDIQRGGEALEDSASDR